MTNQFELFELKGERRRLLQGYSRYGYTPQTALADIIDNSLSADATEIRIDISEQIDGSSKVYITDNGKGMSKDRLKVALAFGSPEDIQNSRLSKFGFGMKTASLEVSPKGFSVLTRSKENGQTSAASLLEVDQEGTGSLNARMWNTQNFDETSLHYLDQLCGKEGSGTLVVWEDADLKEADRYKDDMGGAEMTRKRIENRISKYLGMVFHRWIEGTAAGNKQAKIIFQNEEITPWNPLSEKYIDLEQVDEILPFTVLTETGQQIEMRLTPWVIDKNLPKSVAENEAKKSNKYQGIYLYRMDRIINNPQWFQIRSNKRDPLNGLRFSLEVDPALDDLIHLDVKKSNVDLPDEILTKIAPSVEFYIKSEEARAHTGKAAKNKSKTPLTALESTSKKYKELDKKAPTVRPERQSATEVLTTNEEGGKLLLHMRELPSNLRGENTIHLVQAHETKSLLWEPRTARDLSLQVLINEDHDFYQKVILPSGEAAYEGFIWMLLAFSRAELATQYSDFKLQFSHMRRHMSETLEAYAADIELPDLTTEDE